MSLSIADFPFSRNLGLITERVETMEKQQYIEVMGEEADINGLSECVNMTFGITCEVETLDSYEDPRIRFGDDSDAMAHAFNLGLMMYVRGFVAAKSLGELRIIDDSEEYPDIRLSPEEYVEWEMHPEKDEE